MTWSLNRTLAALLVVALIQSLGLGWMVFDRVRLLMTGKEIVLPVIPVDPRSLFRGDYVRLGYAISMVPPPADAPTTMPRRTILHVTIAKNATGVWTALASSAHPPHILKPGQHVLRGRTANSWHKLRGGTIRMRYGIESYFVQEGHGKKLEKQAGDGQIAAVISVDGAGQAVIKGLMIDGKRTYTEPLF